MQTLPFQKVVDRVAALWDGESARLSPENGALIRVAIRDAIREVWRRYEWPELMVSEERLLRPVFDAAATYSAGDEVFDNITKKYYLCIRDSTSGVFPTTGAGVLNSGYWALAKAEYSADDWTAASGDLGAGTQVYYPKTRKFYQANADVTSGSDPISDPTEWGELVPFVESLALEQEGFTEIGDITGIWTRDTRSFTDDTRLEFLLEGDQAILKPGHGETVFWVKFRKRCPNYEGDEYSASETYAAGDEVYYGTAPNRDYYTVLASTSAGEDPDDTPAKFAKQEFPLVLSWPVVMKAVAELLRNEGQFQKGAHYDGLADDRLFTEMDNIGRQQRQAGTMEVRTV